MYFLFIYTVKNVFVNLQKKCWQQSCQHFLSFHLTLRFVKYNYRPVVIIKTIKSCNHY